MANVELSVYNILGQKVAILVKGEQSAGHYRLTFNGQNLAAGLYVYRLKAGDFVQSKKMILIK